jgi:hypothetical protein
MPTMHKGATVLEPEQMIKDRLHMGNLQVLIKWKGHPPAKSSREEAKLIKIYPTF